MSLRARLRRAKQSLKTKSLPQLKKIVQKLKREGKTIAFTNGCFDILHTGHLKTFKAAKSHGDILVVGLNSDRSVRAIKGRGRPILPQTERAEVLAALEDVDYVTVFNEPDPLKVITTLTPDVLVKGGDWAEDTVIGGDVVKRHGGRVISVPLLKGLSTTRIISRVVARYSKDRIKERGDV